MDAQSSSFGGGVKLEDRLKVINDVDQKVSELLRHAQTCATELSKEKQISKSKMEEASSAFKRCSNSVESDLSTQMQYLSHVCVGVAHQGSTFSVQQGIAIADQTIMSLRDRLASFEQIYLPVSSNNLPPQK